MPQTPMRPALEHTKRAKKRRKVIREVAAIPSAARELLAVDPSDEVIVESPSRGQRRPISKPKSQPESPSRADDDTKWVTLARVDISIVRALMIKLGMIMTDVGRRH